MMQYFTGIGLEKEAMIYAWMIVMLLCGTIMILLGFYHMKCCLRVEKAATGEHSLKESMAELAYAGLQGVLHEEVYRGISVSLYCIVLPRVS